MRFLLTLLALSFTSPSLACPMADAAAYKNDAAKVETAEGTKLALTVKGMTCGDCSQKVHDAVQTVDGVVAVAVDYQTGETKVAFDPAKTNQKAILAAIKSTGYTAKKVELDG